MIPLTASSAPVTSPPPVVNPPAAPASNAPVAAGAVAPSFSIAPAGNNARGNSAVPQAGAEAPASVPTTAAAQNQSPTAPLIPANTSPLAGANFLAQLIGQDASPQAQTVLVEYEKLVYLSTIKYKPSDAMRPQVQPSDVFSKMVSERKNQLSSPAAIISFLAEGDGETVSAAVQASPSVARALRPQPREEQVRQAEEEALAAILDNMPVPAQHFPAQALSAYLNSAGRINSAATSGNDVETA